MYPQKRRFGKRTKLKKFVISSEGGISEVEYFTIFGTLLKGRVVVDIMSDVNHSSPHDVLARIKNYRKWINPGDQKWCVIDKDRWTNNQLEELKAWANESSNDNVARGLAVSNPRFELWLLLHFRAADSETPKRLRAQLEEVIPDYDKHIPPNVITLEAVKTAIGNSVGFGDRPCVAAFGTNLHVLAKAMILAGEAV